MQMHMAIRLIFGDQWAPESTYYLHVKDLSETGRLILNILDKYFHEVNMPGDMRDVKNDIFHFMKNAYNQVLYFYCPFGKTDSKQYLNFGEYFLLLLCV